ncbi:MAG: aldehyde dehydrogenase family protein, partial [Gammaproteobacteria bacterium]|nr:aldehyde dehydrogenase family protein [Gammaproteobacteria bacterium]
KKIIDDAQEKGARIVELNPAGEDWNDPAIHKIPIHLIIDPSDEMLCMQDEIFGPILNVKTYRRVSDCLDYINSKPRPLALYYFGKNKDEQEHILNNSIAGGVSINDIAMHFACDDMPFGGVGPSGMGNYHGFEGFKTFSHAKSVFKQGFVNLPKLAGILPPYSEKVDKMMASQIKR